jgi:hypothetical protein
MKPTLTGGPLVGRAAAAGAGADEAGLATGEALEAAADGLAAADG